MWTMTVNPLQYNFGFVSIVEYNLFAILSHAYDWFLRKWV